MRTNGLMMRGTERKEKGLLGKGGEMLFGIIPGDERVRD